MDDGGRRAQGWHGRVGGGGTGIESGDGSRGSACNIGDGGVDTNDCEDPNVNDGVGDIRNIVGSVYVVCVRKLRDVLRPSPHARFDATVWLTWEDIIAGGSMRTAAVMTVTVTRVMVMTVIIVAMMVTVTTMIPAVKTSRQCTVYCKSVAESNILFRCAPPHLPRS